MSDQKSLCALLEEQKRLEVEERFIKTLTELRALMPQHHTEAQKHKNMQAIYRVQALKDHYWDSTSPRRNETMQATYNVQALKDRLQSKLDEALAVRKARLEIMRQVINERIEEAVEQGFNFSLHENVESIHNEVETRTKSKTQANTARINTKAIQDGLEKLELLHGETVELSDADLHALGL